MCRDGPLGVAVFGGLRHGRTAVAGLLQPRIIEQEGGDYPGAVLDILPAGQHDAAVGRLDAHRFPAVCQALQPDVGTPPVDFDTSLVVLVRNTACYNRSRIARASGVDRVAGVRAMETVSVLPI